MKVSKIVHAGLVVETSKARVLMDPVFVNPIESGTVLLDPPIEILEERLQRQDFDCVILSHEHHDHFCIDSLARLPRSLKVIYPKGCELIRHALERLGFSKTQAVEARQMVKVGDLEVHFSASRAPFAELGAVFRSEHGTCWNLVDTKLTPETIAWARQQFQVDLLLAEYQPLVEANLWRDVLGGGFPYELYQKLIRQVIEINPKIVVPFSCNFVSATEGWINERLFPVTEERFLRDVRRCLPALAVATLGPGMGIELHTGTSTLIEKSLDFVRTLSERKVSHHDWRPDRGVPPLQDKNVLGVPLEDLRREIAQFVERDFIDKLNDPSLADFTRPFRQRQATWNLKILFPDGESVDYWMDFGAEALSWQQTRSDASGVGSDLSTSIAASAIWGIRKGRLSPFSLIFGGMIRRTHRLYQLNGDGIVWPDSIQMDPFYPVLCSGSVERVAHLKLKSRGC